MTVELRLMRYVITVAEEGGFQRAAERLHMAQPPLSRQIRDLERELGVRLFERRPTRLTEAGRVFVESARQVLAAAEETVLATRRAARGELGVVRLGYAPSVAHETLPALLAAMRDRHPDVRVEPREGWSRDLERGLRADQFDVVLARGLSARTEFAREALRTEHLVVIVGAGNPLARRAGAAVRLAELRGQTFCFYPRDLAPDSYDAVLAALHHTGERFDIWTDPVPQQRHQRLRDAAAFTVVPESMRDHLPAGTVGLSLLDDLPMVALELVWKPKALSPWGGTFIEVARQVGRAEGWTRGS